MFKSPILAVVVFLIRQDPDGGGREQIFLPMITSGYCTFFRNGPGGKQEPGESPKTCAVREMWEETKVRVDINSLELIALLQHLQPGSHYEVSFFTCHSWTGTPQKTKSADPANAWFPIFTPPFKQMLPDFPLWFPTWLSLRAPIKVEVASSGGTIRSCAIGTM